jgi:hypothetical protein
LLSFSPEAVVRGSGEVSEIRTRIGSVRDRWIDGADFMQRERERERETGSEERIWDGAIVFFFERRKERWKGIGLEVKTCVRV